MALFFSADLESGHSVDTGAVARILAEYWTYYTFLLYELRGVAFKRFQACGSMVLPIVSVVRFLRS